MAFRGRLVQLGAVRGRRRDASPSADIRFKELSILGHTNFATPPDERAGRAAADVGARRGRRAARRRARPSRWTDAAGRVGAPGRGPGRKLVVVP